METKPKIKKNFLHSQWKKISLGVIVAVFIGGALLGARIFAFDPKGHPMDRSLFAFLFRDIKLSDSQKKQLQSMIDQNQGRMMAMQTARKNGLQELLKKDDLSASSIQSFLTNMSTLAEGNINEVIDGHFQMVATLDKDQKQILENNLSQSMNRWEKRNSDLGKGKKDGDFSRRKEWISERLSLDSTQKAELEKITQGMQSYLKSSSMADLRQNIFEKLKNPSTSAQDLKNIVSQHIKEMQSRFPSLSQDLANFYAKLNAKQKTDLKDWVNKRWEKMSQRHLMMD